VTLLRNSECVASVGHGVVLEIGELQVERHKLTDGLFVLNQQYTRPSVTHHALAYREAADDVALGGTPLPASG
jgi:hypothetical protein